MPDVADVLNNRQKGKTLEGKKAWTGDKADEIRKHGYSIDDLMDEMRKVVSEVMEKAKEMEARQAGKGAGSVVELIKPAKPRLSINLSSLDMALNSWYEGEIVQSYSRYSRRFPMLPTTKYMGPGTIYVLVDVSGSIGTDELQQFAGEIDALARRYGKVVLLQWDVGLRSVEEVTNRLYELKVTGRGGTELAPALREFLNKYEKKIMMEGGRPALIIFSDFELADEPEATEILNQIANRFYIIQVSVTDKFLDVPRSVKIKLKL